jgi:hypothetical protein
MLPFLGSVRLKMIAVGLLSTASGVAVALFCIASFAACNSVFR